MPQHAPRLVSDFAIHDGPLLAGDLIVIEIAGMLVPNSNDSALPQWFIVRHDQKGNESVLFTPCHNPTRRHVARRYVAGGMTF